jgi:hypothetical protein
MVPILVEDEDGVMSFGLQVLSLAVLEATPAGFDCGQEVPSMLQQVCRSWRSATSYESQHYQQKAIGTMHRHHWAKVRWCWHMHSLLCLFKGQPLQNNTNSTPGRTLTCMCIPLRLGSC